MSLHIEEKIIILLCLSLLPTGCASTVGKKEGNFATVKDYSEVGEVYVPVGEVDDFAEVGEVYVAGSDVDEGLGVEFDQAVTAVVKAPLKILGTILYEIGNMLSHGEHSGPGYYEEYVPEYDHDGSMVVGSAEKAESRFSRLAILKQGNRSNLSYEEVAESVCRILSYDEGREGSLDLAGSCSGFLISEYGHVVTSAHCLSADFFYAVFSDGEHFLLRPVFQDSGADIALLVVEDEAFLDAGISPLAVSRLSSIPFGEEVFVIGYPSLSNDSAAVYQPVMSKGSLSGSSVDLGDGVWHIIDITASSGNSGGPVILKSSGRVVGVMSAIFHPENLEEYISSGYRVKASRSRDLIDSFGLDYDE